MTPLIKIPCTELQHLYEDERMTTVQLGIRYGCSITTISKRLHTCGVAVRSARFQAREIPEDELRRMYVDEHLPVAVIAQYFDVSVNTIYNRRRSYGLPRRRDAAAKT